MSAENVGTVPPHRLACLCHDIGKLGTRANSSDGTFTDQGHAGESETFLRDSLGADRAADIVAAHHGESADTPHEEVRDGIEILQAANQLSKQSSGEDEDHEAETPRLTDVFGVFGADSDRTYPLEPLAIDDGMFATESDSVRNRSDVSDAYDSLHTELTGELSAHSNYERLVSVIEKYTWCIPADLTGNTTPLYDHLRTTAALGDALAGSGLTGETLRQIGEGDSVETELFTLVKGDISGIQDFIHQMRSPDDAQERFAKRLRGRSTQLWLLTEGLARLFLDRLDLPWTSLIWSGGGQFYAVIPPKSDATVDEFEREVNEWLVDRYDAELFFVAGRTTAESTDTPFSTLFGRAASDADRRKQRKAGPAVGALESAVLGPPVEPCRSCGRDNRHGGTRCRVCQTQEALGSAMATATHVSFTKGERDDADYTIDLSGGGLSWYLTTGPIDADRCYRLNETTINDAREDGFVFTGATVPHGGAVDRVWSFRELSDLGRSDADYVHVGKMDIDSLGEAISTGMEGGPTTLAALSRALDRFFAGYVNRLAEEAAYWYPTPDACETCQELLAGGEQRHVDHTEGPGSTAIEAYTDLPAETERALHSECVTSVTPIYIGFSGGDDMFFVGPWDEAIDFGRTVRERFAEYTDRTLTLSGGFFLTGPSYPVGRAVKQAESSLEKAKDTEYEGQTKNAMHLFSQTHVWETPTEQTPGMEELLTFGERLESLINDDELPRSVLHNFAKLHEDEYPKQLLHEEVTVPKDASWRLKYILARQFEGELLAELEKKLPPALPWLDVPVSWASLATR